MASKGWLCDKTVIVKSIECIKAVIHKLDQDQGDFDGVAVVLSQFSPNEVIAKPEAVLDQMIIYLHCVHSIDWYSESWVVKGRQESLTVRPDPGLVVSSLGGREQEKEEYLRRLTYRTELFVQVVLSLYYWLHNLNCSKLTNSFIGRASKRRLAKLATESRYLSIIGII